MHIHIEDTSSGQTFYLWSYLINSLKGTNLPSHHQIKQNFPNFHFSYIPPKI